MEKLRPIRRDRELLIPVLRPPTPVQHKPPHTTRRNQPSNLPHTDTTILVPNSAVGERWVSHTLNNLSLTLTLGTPVDVRRHDQTLPHTQNPHKYVT